MFRAVPTHCQQHSRTLLVTVTLAEQRQPAERYRLYSGVRQPGFEPCLAQSLTSSVTLGESLKARCASVFSSVKRE